MGRLEWSYQFFSKDGLKFLMLELVIVFLGVYGAFLLQSYSENQKLRSERDKILIGLKEDLEYFRIFFPQFSEDMQQRADEWEDLLANDQYFDYSEWRFIQPQYDYTVVEYALNADADVIDFELNSSLSQLYIELEKLRQAEELITQAGLSYKRVPDTEDPSPEILMAQLNNLQNLKRLKDRALDRVAIMNRIARLSEMNLETINAEFTARELKEIELLLIEKYMDSIASEQEREYLIRQVLIYFPEITEEEVRSQIN